MTAFLRAYDALLGRWPVPVESVDVETGFDTTRVHRCGPVDAPPLVLLPGYGATSTVWAHNVAVLSRYHRVHAVDLVGDAGRSVPGERPARSVTDLVAWLDAVVAGLGPITVCGHSYGAWLALSYAVRRPAVVRKLILLDPTDCFAGLALGYRLRAVPQFVRPGGRAVRSFLRWETAGAGVDPDWLDLAELAAGETRGPLVLPRRPTADALRNCPVPTRVLLAERSRSHDIARVAAGARRALPDVTTAVLPGATHHSIPTADPDRVNAALLGFLNDAPAP